MNPARAIPISLLTCLALHAEDRMVLPDEVVEAAQFWMQENMGDWLFDAAGIDRGDVDASLMRVQEELRAIMPTNTEPRRADAEQLLAVFEVYESTQPYASWLRSLLHDNRTSPLRTNTPTLPPPSPTPRQAHDLWLSVMRSRPVPTRAQDHLSQIKPIFQSEKVPPELVWIAEVESAFDPQARSPVGAVGLFQLMPDTAKSLGLSTWFPDERRNAKKSARAAAQYLHYLHDRFGDWPLALAGYNAGPTRVARLLRKSDVYRYEAIADQLPAETRDYVVRVEATVFVREGVELRSLSQAHCPPE